MEFKGRQERQECYIARDQYFECYEKQVAKDPEERKKGCLDRFAKFEKACGQKWTEHFVRKHDYLKYKERLEKDGIDAYDKKYHN